MNKKDAIDPIGNADTEKEEATSDEEDTEAKERVFAIQFHGRSEVLYNTVNFSCYASFAFSCRLRIDLKVNAV